MNDDQKIITALKADASQVQLPADLLARIHREAAPPAPPSLWSRLRIGPKAELVAACLLLIALIGIGALRNLGPDRAPAGGGQGTETPGTAAQSTPGQIAPGTGAPQCCPAEGHLTAAEVMARFTAARLDPRISGDLGTKLFGATQVNTIAVDGENIVVYTFADGAGAEQAHRTMSDPQAHTVGWVGIPRFFRMGNLVVQIDFSNRTVAEKLQAALFTGQPRPDPKADSGDLQWVPTVEQVRSAYIPGQPKMPDWRLTPEAIGKILAMLQTAQLISGDETVPPPPAGPVGRQPLILTLELISGDRITIRLAGDCETTSRADGSQVTTCKTAEDQVLVAVHGRMMRYRAPELAQWLMNGWPSDVHR